MTGDSEARPRLPVGRVVVLTAAVFVAAYLLTRHLNHLWQLLPYGLLLACPLMHLMHHGHHRHGPNTDHPTV